ncbi:hypothetical protein GE300_15320 [Rhodobacteraceae bacterium 2CG4]|uniref:FAS1-like dehydratase domain-containing protein n=1 Tax=Halovulum marinum TaxID=2662447 RepID=A0A6L5Z312_9RHOB|nr:MaoC family dehydratase N-terminal domain-containing protein [Halovulum marinum]MSU90963.1 hypothetical protein [Halovulum marinum]
MNGHEDWIGRSASRDDLVSARLVAQYRTTLGALCGPGEVPAGFHWCLAPDIFPAGELGRDGHPRPGLVVPELPLPRRMWAGGEISFHAPFAVGETVTRTSTVRDITFKTGRSGRLGFVAVDHDYAAGGAARLTERHDIVYREDPTPGQATATPEPGADWTPLRAWTVTPDPTLLFRYSAVTFNGHRIHYDQPYATAVEGYDGLVVHGPLQSSWMQNLAAEILGALPARFRYRGLSPLVAGQAVTVEARETGDGLELRVCRDADGVVTMQASAAPAGI